MRNAFSGYSYQQLITLLLLSKMDVEREISNIEIEAKVDDMFDDLKISLMDEVLSFQIKDFDCVDLSELIIEDENILIKRKKHKLSKNKNIIFFKHIDITPNSEILGFDCYKISNIYIVSLNRNNADTLIDKLYKDNISRKFVISSFLNNLLDRRIWNISILDLPALKTFNTELQEDTLNINHKLLKFEKILLIEGKPGVGKSHFVNSLTELYPNHILYRFWTGNQDADYLQRLKFSNFKQDLNIKLFKDLKKRPLSDLFNELKKKKIVVIIDGLDHVENYNNSEVKQFIDFINELKEYCKVIVLSRPLFNTLIWKKQVLENWNKNQTEQVLEKLFYINEYKIKDRIFYLTKGYPILVKYVAEFYKLNKTLPKIEQLKSIDNFYDEIIKNEKGTHSLSVFLATSSYIRLSEIELFLDESKYYVEEFIKEHPYLFDIKLNRIALFHDSFTTYLHNRLSNYTIISEKVNNIVYKSVLKLEKRFLSRLSLFKLTFSQKIQIIKKYSSIDTFEKIIKDNIDIEAVQSFYFDLRNSLYQYSFKDFTIENYYDLSLIINLLYRNHINTVDGFLYSYTKTLVFNNYTEEDIESSGYLFSMLFYIKTGNPILLFNMLANESHLTDFFYTDLEKEIRKEENFFKLHSRVVTKKRIKELLKDKLHFRDYLTLIIENLYIHQKKYKDFEVLLVAIETYLSGFESRGAIELAPFLDKYSDSHYYADWYLRDVKNNLLAKGYEVSKINKNDYNLLTLNDLIVKYKEMGSFDLREKIHEYIRLSLHREQKIDISSISLFWTKYYNRKDYTLLSIPIALKTLESKKLISLENSINLITKVQNISEKGYRFLLGEFIELYKPFEIIPFLEKYNLDNIKLDWFSLPTKYINTFSDKTYNYALNQLLSYHRSGWVELRDIKNVLLSRKIKDIELAMSIVNLKIRAEKSDPILDKLKNNKLFFDIYDDTDKDKYKINSYERYKTGILNYDDLDFIKQNNLTPQEIAKFSDGNYASLSDVKLYEIFEKKEITKNFQEILFNAIIGKTLNIDYSYSLYYLPGNILNMINNYRNIGEFERAKDSFLKFLKLSLLNINK